MRQLFALTTVLAFSFSIGMLAGCQKPAEKIPAGQVKTKNAAAGYESSAAPSGKDLFRHITEEEPYKKWDLWPGKGEFEEGTEPHGELISVYVNDKALESIKKVQGMVDGSIVIKENYTKDKKLTSYSLMKKVKGYNPDGSDWFWVRYSPEFAVLNEGKVSMCHDCHAAAETNDYIFTGSVTAQGVTGHAPGYGAPGYNKEGKKAPGYGAPGYGKEGKKAPGYGAPGYDKEGEKAPGYGAPGYDKEGKKAPAPAYGTPGHFEEWLKNLPTGKQE